MQLPRSRGGSGTAGLIPGGGRVALHPRGLETEQEAQRTEREQGEAVSRPEGSAAQIPFPRRIADTHSGVWAPHRSGLPQTRNRRGPPPAHFTLFIYLSIYLVS